MSSPKNPAKKSCTPKIMAKIATKNKGCSVTPRNGSELNCLYSLSAIIHTVVIPPSRNITVPKEPKKYIGERPKCDINDTVIRSKYPFTIRSIPNLDTPYLRS